LLLKKVTTLFTGVALKFVPVIVTDVPTGPDAGEKDAIIGPAAAVPWLSFSTNALLFDVEVRLNLQGPGSKSPVL
jgi:hypothetical protein